MATCNQIQAAQEKLKGVLAEFNGFGGIGITEVDNQQCLLVYIDDGQEAEIKPHVPDEVDGVSVVTRVKGSARFLSM